MGHAVHLPHRLDRLVRILDTGGRDEAGVRHEQVDGTVRVERRLDHRDDRRFVAHVDRDCRAADVRRHAFRLGTVQVGDHHMAGTRCVRGAGDGFTDARSGSGDHDDSIVQFHSPAP